MILDPYDKAAFAEYEEPLRNLEKAFISAGAPIHFFLHEAPLKNKLVGIFLNGNRQKNICIEGDSPAQAVKDVAAGVRL